MTEISLTENAAKRVAWIAERQSKPAILRLAVDGGGCAGFTYKFELADGPDGDALPPLRVRNADHCALVDRGVLAQYFLDLQR